MIRNIQEGICQTRDSFRLLVTLLMKENPYLKLEMLNNRFKDLHPVILEWSVTMAWNWDLSHLSKWTIDNSFLQLYAAQSKTVVNIIRHLFASFRSETRTKSGKSSGQKFERVIISLKDDTSEPSASFSFLMGGKAGLSGAVTPDTTESTSDTPVSDSVSMTAS